MLCICGIHAFLGELSKVKMHKMQRPALSVLFEPIRLGLCEMFQFSFYDIPSSFDGVDLFMYSTIIGIYRDTKA